MLAFVAMVLIPSALTGFYLRVVAVDQYASTVQFTVRREEAPSAASLMNVLPNLSTGSSSDSDVLFEFIQSQEMVQAVDGMLDLRSMYSGPHDRDPFFALAPEANIEELMAYWARMVQISYAAGTGLIEVRSLAFNPEDAQAVNEAIFRESSRVINDISAIAREDAMSFATDEFERSTEALRAAREALTVFRSREQVVDPTADLQLQMSVLGGFQQDLGRQQIELDLLRDTVPDGDPRLQQVERRIAALNERIEEERAKFGGGIGSTSIGDYAELVAEFERLNVDLEIASATYTAALASLETARTNAQRQSRYLAAFVRPTLAQSAQHPRRLLLWALATMVLIGVWAVTTLLYYSLRDRK
ncbi:MAG: sugar transporter [Shimia sp.]